MKVNNDIYSLLADKIMPLAQIADEKNSYYYSELFSLDIYTRGWFTGYLKEE